MQNSNRYLRYTITALLFLALIGVRFIGKSIFNDPFIAFFSGVNFSLLPLPEFDFVSYLSQISLRYSINSLISLGILFFLFQKKDILKIAAMGYVVIGIVMLCILGYQVAQSHPNYTVLLFARRVLMHPIVLLILIPAIYFQLKKEASNEVEKQ